MIILVEIDLPDIDPDDIYKPNSGWFNEPGYIDIPYSQITQIPYGYRFKYIGQVHEDSPRL